MRRRCPGSRSCRPRQIVAELDRYIVGQDAAKRRWRSPSATAGAARRRRTRSGTRSRPYNIILIGPTGVGKTEIARRLARLAGAPFVKVEASKFTEVGYVGRDAESMVRDLVDAAISMVRTEREDEVYPAGRAAGRGAAARHPAAARPPPPAAASAPRAERAPRHLRGRAQRAGAPPSHRRAASEERRSRSREKLRQMLHEGKLDEREVEIEVHAAELPDARHDAAAPGHGGRARSTSSRCSRR